MPSPHDGPLSPISALWPASLEMRRRGGAHLGSTLDQRRLRTDNTSRLQDEQWGEAQVSGQVPRSDTQLYGRAVCPKVFDSRTKNSRRFVS